MADPIRFPIGEYMYNPADFPGRKDEWIAQIAACPTQLRAAVKGLNDKQLDTPYRDGGWTTRQIIHHVADSHMQAYFRIKLALTENLPIVKPYSQDEFVKLADTTGTPIELSLALVDNLHARWAMLMKALGTGDFVRAFSHPEYGEIPIARALSHYAWHGRQHTAHIIGLRERKRW
jgi:hypothetical protein